MRTRTGGENTILSAAVKAVKAVKVEIKDAAGAYQDWFSRLLSVSWGASVDQPIAELRLTLRRDSGPSASLSPFRGDSTLNIGGAAIDAGRDIKISPATTAWGVTPVSGDYKLLFQGKTADIDFANTAMEVIARDLGGALVKKQIKETSQVRDETGIPLEDVIQDLLDLWAPGTTLFTPVSPGFLVTSQDWGKGSLFEAIRTAAGSIGWDIRYLWDNGTSAFRLTLFEPDRTKTTPDWTIAKDRYFKITQLAIRADDVRNYIQVSFLNASTGLRETVFATDPTSVARFEEQWMEIVEADTSPINSTAEAQALADAALADLAWPIAEKAVEIPFFWPVEVGDLIRFTANAIHSDGDIDLAVSSFQHRLERGTARTTLFLRGKPAGFYRDWIRRGKGEPPGPGTPPAGVAEVTSLGLSEPSDGVLNVAIDIVNTQVWHSYEKLGAWPTFDNTPDGLLDPGFIRMINQPNTQRSYKHDADVGTWYVIVLPYNESGQPGVRASASLAISGTASAEGILTDLAAAYFAGTDDIQLTWNTNAAVDAGTRYRVSIYRDNVLQTSGRNARMDADNSDPGTSGVGGWRDAAVSLCTGTPFECTYRTFEYRVVLVDTLSAFPDKTYTTNVSGYFDL